MTVNTTNPAATATLIKIEQASALTQLDSSVGYTYDLEVDVDHTIMALSDLGIELFASNAEELLAALGDRYSDDDYAGEECAQNFEHLAKLIRALRPWSPPMLTKEGEAA